MDRGGLRGNEVVDELVSKKESSFASLLPLLSVEQEAALTTGGHQTQLGLAGPRSLTRWSPQ